MDVKFQIFISSTYLDLIEERNAVIEAILKIGHIPIGMEMFKAEDVDSWEVIKRTIESADYYVVIIGHKYGSISKTGKSFTEMEYDYAVKLGIPTLAFIIDDIAARKANQMEDNEEKIQKLRKFKKKLEKKNRDTWKNSSDLSYKLISSLTSQFNINPRPGWIKNDKSYSNSMDELTRLSKENNELREKIIKLEEQKKDVLREPLLKILFSEELSFKIKTPQKRIRIEKPTDGNISYQEQRSNQIYNRNLSSTEQYDKYNSEMFSLKYAELNTKNIKISLENIGNIKATLIDVIVVIPEKLVLFNELRVPHHTQYVKLNEPDNCIDEYQNQEMQPLNIQGICTTENWSSSKDIVIRANSVKFNLDTLIHTKSRERSIRLLPLKKGKYDIEIKYLCNEYPKQIIELIPVVIR